MVQAEEIQQNWWLVEKLTPSIFSENYLYKNGDNKVVLMSECSGVYEKRLLSKSEESVVNYMQEADLAHQHYAKCYARRRDVESNKIKYRILWEASPYKLFDLIEKAEKKRITEGIARYYLFQLLDVLEQLHAKTVYYLTLRSEDLALDSNFNLKLGNFSIANAIIKCCGNFEFVKEIQTKNTSLAPEMSKADNFSEKSDIFNLGVLLFSMVVGFRPFRELNTLSDVLFRQISNNDSKNYWTYVQKASKLELSENFKDLVFRMMAVDSSQRIGIQQIREHAWLNTLASDYNYIVRFFQNLLVNKKKNNNFKKNNNNFNDCNIEPSLNEHSIQSKQSTNLSKSKQPTPTHPDPLDSIQLAINKSLVIDYLKQFFENLKNLT